MPSWGPHTRLWPTALIDQLALPLCLSTQNHAETAGSSRPRRFRRRHSTYMSTTRASWSRAVRKPSRAHREVPKGGYWVARRRRVSPYCGAHFARHVAPSFAPRSEPPNGGRKGTAVHFVRPVLPARPRKRVCGTQLNVLRAAVRRRVGLGETIGTAAAGIESVQTLLPHTVTTGTNPCTSMYESNTCK